MMRITERIFAPAAVLGLLASWPAGPSSAAECHGIEFPQTIEVQGTPLVLNGLGIRKATFLKVRVYVAALYVPQGARPDARAIIASPGPMQLVLHFVRGVGARDIRNAFEEGFEAQGGGRVPVALASRVALLNSWMQDMHSGEVMTLVRIPGRGIELELDRQTVGDIPGEDFGQALFAIWLGDHPPNPELRSGLLGGRCE
jgi:chalcone isomerase-like protein